MKENETVFDWLNGLRPPTNSEEFFANNTTEMSVNTDVLAGIDEVDLNTIRKIRRKRKEVCNIVEADIPAVFGDCMTIYTANDKIPAKYALVKIDDILASNDEVTFAANPLYPQSCQERNYDSDIQLKANVSSRSNSFEPLFIVNNVPTAEDGPPIISQQGVVLGGNSRVMILKNIYKAVEQNKINEYYSEIFEQLEMYGFSHEKYATAADLVGLALVRIIDGNKKECAYYSRIFNTSTKDELSITAIAVSYSRLLSKKEIGEIAYIIEKSGADTLSEILKSGQPTTKKIIEILQRTNIINKTNVNMFLVMSKRNTLSIVGKELVGMTLVACLFSKIEEIELVQSNPDLQKEVLNNIGNLLVIKDLAGDWNITPSIIKIAQSENDKNKYSDSDDLYGNKITLNDTDDVLLRVLRLKAKDARVVLNEYISLAHFQNPSTGEMFEITKITPAMAMESAIDAVFGDGNQLNLGDNTMNIYKIFERYGTWDVPQVQDYLNQYNATLSQIDAPFIAVCPLRLNAKNPAKRPFALYTHQKDGCGKVTLLKKVSDKKAVEWLAENGYDFKKIFGFEPFIPAKKAVISCDEKIEDAIKNEREYIQKEWENMNEQLKHRDDVIAHLRKENGVTKDLKKVPKKCPKKSKTIHVDTLTVRADENIEVGVNGRNLGDRSRAKKSALRKFWEWLP
jgi:hypothetical protein